MPKNPKFISRIPSGLSGLSRIVEIPWSYVAAFFDDGHCLPHSQPVTRATTT
jgi:hypothetical protein